MCFVELKYHRKKTLSKYNLKLTGMCRISRVVGLLAPRKGHVLAAYDLFGRLPRQNNNESKTIHFLPQLHNKRYDFAATL